VPYNKLLTNRASSSRTGEYYPSVVFVRTPLRSLRTATPRANISQYGARARLVRGYYSSRLALNSRQFFIQSEVPDRTSLVCVFPRIAFATCNYLQFWLAHCIACVVCDRIELLLWFWFYDTQLKTTLMSVITSSVMTVQTNGNPMATQWQPNGNPMATQWQPNGNPMATLPPAPKTYYNFKRHDSSNQWQPNGNPMATLLPAPKTYYNTFPTLRVLRGSHTIYTYHLNIYRDFTI